jgi:hypothetical protein
MTEELVEELLKTVEEDEEGKVTFEEFMKIITPVIAEEGEKPEGEEDGEPKPVEGDGEIPAGEKPEGESPDKLE